MTNRTAAFACLWALTTSCGGVWHPAHVDDLYDRTSALVITVDRAYELDNAQVKDSLVSGDVLQVWQVTYLNDNYLNESKENLRHGDSPQEVAQMLRWQPLDRPRMPVSVPTTNVRYLRIRRETHYGAPLIAVVAVLCVLFVFSAHPRS